ncbi:hypothetical protein P4H46_10985 [Paenibacillus glucanolyticus]|uniref:hypothetical protein n=1 Tax=Paenibacillus glucanolyticus TaxID=59843 RepID=UPI0030C98E29
MKKHYVLVLLMILTLVGCNTKSISLTGESDSWSGEYTANINRDKENGKFIFGYKNATGKELKNLEITINDGKRVLKEENYKGAIIEMPSSCSGCAVTNETLPIKVKIKWDEKEDTFDLKSDK